jgi:hypothetical protein
MIRLFATDRQGFAQRSGLAAVRRTAAKLGTPCHRLERAAGLIPAVRTAGIKPAPLATATRERL